MLIKARPSLTGLPLAARLPRLALLTLLLSLLSVLTVWAVWSHASPAQTLSSQAHLPLPPRLPATSAPGAAIYRTDIFGTNISGALVTGALATALGPTLTPTTSATATATPATGCVPWQIVSSPNLSSRDTELYDVAAIAPNDVWAVGYYDDTSDNAQTLTIHWDGSQWTQIPSPSPEELNYLSGVAAISSTDVWAVGIQDPSGSGERTLTMHWDGSKWSVVPSPHPGTGSDDLYDVTALPTGEVWAVGAYATVEGVHALTIHWTGTQWEVVPSPDPGLAYGYTDLRGVSAVSGNDIWAVGHYRMSASILHSLTIHWDGAKWSLVPSPDPRPQATVHFVEKVAAISTNDVWAVGNRNPDASTLTMHWDGVQWSVVPSPNPHRQINYLVGVAGTTSDDVWAVGWRGASTMVLHWAGSQWDLVPSDNYPQAANNLRAVSALSRTEAWAVGRCQACLGSGGYYRTLSERYLASCPMLTATATPTPSSTPTFTSTPIRSPTPTPAIRVCNPTRITIPGYGTATPYPSNIKVSGVQGTITGVGVTLNSLRHEFPDDMDMLLTGPRGQSVVLMSDAGGACHNRMDLSFQDGEPALPNESCPTPGVVYRPTNYPPDPDNFAPPAPTPPYGSEFSVFNGTDPNGPWSLYVVDDYGLLPGQIGGGWCLSVYARVTGVGTPTSTSTSTSTSTATPTSDPTSTATVGRSATPTPTSAASYSPTAAATVATATPCNIAFTDVHPTDYFYEAVRYLYCHGAISGYSDNTFRSYSSITRAQVCKVLVLAEGWPINTQGGPHFFDVQSTYWAYDYVETLYNHGQPGSIISGYGDGTFRPANTMTRGQLSKVIVLAEAWPINTQGGPHFFDVPPDNSFYRYIETAYNHNTISGYSDHTFRWGSPTTRGQAAKILYSSLTSPSSEPAAK